MFSEIVVANKNYAACAINKPESLDQTAIKVIRYDCPSFLLPIRLVNIDNQMQLRYELSSGIRLTYLSMNMRKKEFNQLLGQMIAPFMDCADWFLDYHNIYLDRNYIMVDQNDYKVKYIYTPLVRGKVQEEELLKFFAEFVMEVDLLDDQAYITSVMRCIMGKEASLRALASMLRKQTQKAPFVPESVRLEPIKTEPAVPEQKVQPEASLPLRSGQKYGENNLAGAIGAGLFSDDSGSKKKNKKESKNENKIEKDKKSKGFFGKLLEGDKKNKSEPANEKVELSPAINECQQPQIQTEPQAYDVAVAANFNTEIEDDGEGEGTDTLRMRLESSVVDNVPELIELDMSKVCVVVGRYDKTGKMSADFNFDMSLTYIGRRHARFEKVGEEFFMIDLESKNHTYLNSEELLPNRRYPLHKGDRITFTKKYGITYRVC